MSMWDNSGRKLMKKVILLVKTISILILIVSCGIFNETTINSADDMQTTLVDDLNEYESFFPVMFEVNNIFQDLGKAYKIDLEYMAEMNENKDVYPGKKLEITYRYVEKWKEKMYYLYNVLYEAMDKIENEPSFELYRPESFKNGKEAFNQRRHGDL